MINKNIKKLLIILFAGILLTLGIAVYSQICKEKDIEFYAYKKGIYVVSIDSGYFGKNSDIYVSDYLERVENVAQKNSAKVAINAGFFDPGNGKTTSYVFKNGEIVVDPEKNECLTSSEGIKPYFSKILNRSEFRVLSCQDGMKFNIKQHNEPIEKDCRLNYSIQAGPELVPSFNLEEEFFVLKKKHKVVRQSACALKKFARSAIGIKKDRILLVAASNKNPLTLKELADFMKSLGVEQAMAFDGGSSTSLYVDIPEKREFILNSAKDNAARRVKSILILR